jgi:hypothetical protein
MRRIEGGAPRLPRGDRARGLALTTRPAARPRRESSGRFPGVPPDVPGRARTQDDRLGETLAAVRAFEEKLTQGGGGRGRSERPSETAAVAGAEVRHSRGRRRGAGRGPVTRSSGCPRGRRQVPAPTTRRSELRLARIPPDRRLATRLARAPTLVSDALRVALHLSSVTAPRHRRRSRIRAGCRCPSPRCLLRRSRPRRRRCRARC